MRWISENHTQTARTNKMKTFAFFFMALFAGALALPLVDQEFEEDPEFGFEDEIFDEYFHGFEDKIVGGNITTIEEHPHQLNLRIASSHNCGGSVLSATVGLTAAHCLQLGITPSRYTIMAGSTLRLGDANAQLRPLSRFMRHPQNIPSRITNDVGLMFWEKPLFFGPTVRPINLPEQSSPVPYGENCTVSGWGRIREGGPVPNILRVVEKPIVSNEECNRTYDGRITNDMMCAGLPQGGADSCHGDSGGPLLVDNVILGVVSWGQGCARPGYPGVYARVSYFTNWIIENMNP